jgi:hypothetical protein
MRDAERFESTSERPAHSPPAPRSGVDSSHLRLETSVPRAAETAGGLAQGHRRAPNMNESTIDIDMRELHDAANLVRNVAVRRFGHGHSVHVLNVLADEIMRALYVLACGEGRTMEDDTPTDDRAVLKRDARPTTENHFMVGKLDDTVWIAKLNPRRLSADEALNIAAYLLVFADEPVAFDHVNVAGAVLSVEFVELLRAVQLLQEK